MIDFFLNYFRNLSVIDLGILITFASIYLLLFILRWILTGRFLFFKSKINNETSDNSISFISALRNEETKIRNNLAQFLSTQAGTFEMVVVDDFSQDNSYTELGLLREKHKNLILSSLTQETRNSYKLAQNIALKAAKNNWVVVIPAGVQPLSNTFASHSANFLSDEKSVILQYANAEPKKKWANKLYRIERFFLQLKSFGFSALGLPFVYFEENVAFKKHKYFELGGFGGEMNEPYANLEIIINKFITRKNKGFNLTNESILHETAEIGKNDYFELLKKSFRIERRLPFHKKFFVFTIDFLHMVYLPFLVFVGIRFFEIWIILSLLLFIRIINDLLIIKVLQNRLNERKLFLSSLVYELLIPYFKFYYRIKFRRQSRNQKWRSKI